MSSTGLASPPRSVSSAAPTPPPRPPNVSSQQPSRSRSRPTHERIFGWALIGSIAAHLLLLILSPLFLTVGIRPGDVAPSSDALAARQEIQLINAVPSATAPEDPVAEERPAIIERWFPVPVRPGPRPADQPTPRGISPAPDPGTPSTSEALRPGFRDSRLYVNPRDITSPSPQRSDHQRYMDHLQARIEAINDSVAGDAERARRATDWTVKDGQGRRWGLSPDGLHLGGITVPPELVPRPAATGDNAQIEKEREQQRRREEIQGQEQRREREAVQRERARATRERNATRRAPGAAARDTL